MRTGVRVILASPDIKHVYFDSIMITDDLEYATNKALPVQQKNFAKEYEIFAEQCEHDRIKRLAERKRIENDHKRLNIVAGSSNPNRHEEL